MQFFFYQLKAVSTQKLQDLSQVRLYGRRFANKASNSNWLAKFELLSSSGHMILMNDNIIHNESWLLGLFALQCLSSLFKALHFEHGIQSWSQGTEPPKPAGTLYQGEKSREKSLRRRDNRRTAPWSERPDTTWTGNYWAQSYSGRLKEWKQRLQ